MVWGVKLALPPPEGFLRVMGKLFTVNYSLCFCFSKLTSVVVELNALGFNCLYSAAPRIPPHFLTLNNIKTSEATIFFFIYGNNIVF